MKRFVVLVSDATQKELKALNACLYTESLFDLRCNSERIESYEAKALKQLDAEHDA